MEERWYQLTKIELPRARVIIDVSRSGEKLWPMLYSLISGLTETLPRESWPEVLFLGDTISRPLAEFTSQHESLYQADRYRGRVMGPTFHHLETLTPTNTVLIGCGPILDLEDWHDTPIVGRTIFTKLLDSIQITNNRYAEPIVSMDELTSWVNLSFQSLTIRLPKGIPTDGDRTEYRYLPERIVSESSGNLPLRFAYISESSDPPFAEIRLSNGGVIKQDVIPCEPLASPLWRNLPNAEFTIIDQWRRNGGYLCQCGQTHPAGQWCCTSDAEPRPLLTSLKELNSDTWVKFRCSAFNGKWMSPRIPALRLEQDTVILADDDGQMVHYRYNHQRECWEPQGASQKFVKLEENQYAIVV